MGGIIENLRIYLDKGLNSITNLLNSKADLELELIADSDVYKGSRIDFLYLISRKSYPYFSGGRIRYRVSRKDDNGKKLVKDFEGRRLVTELDSVSPVINELLGFFREYEDNGKTVSCTGINYFEMEPARFRNGLYVVEGKISLPLVYHTHDERFNKLREGLF